LAQASGCGRESERTEDKALKKKTKI